MGVIVIILIISFLVIIHELGHFLAAWWAKVRVFEFGLGYPPLAKKLFKWRGVDFTLNWVPFGGFVKMAGEDSDEEDEKGKKLPKEPQQPGFEPLYKRPWWKRLVVICAGAAINILFGFFIFFGLTTVYGVPELLSEARIAKVVADSPAAKANLPQNVRVLSLKAANQELKNPSAVEMQEFVLNHRGQEIEVGYSGPCNGLSCAESYGTTNVYVRTESETPAGQGALGITFEVVVFIKYPWYEVPFRAVVYSVQQSVAMILLIWQALGNMVGGLFTKGSVPSELSGPIGIVYEFQRSGIVEEGFTSIISFMAVLSINLGVMNMLPIPALDGGRALFVVLEQLLGKQTTSKVEKHAHFVGYIFLLALIVLISARDVWRIVVALLQG